MSLTETIKPVARWCRECGQTGDHFPRCSYYMAPDEETSRVDVFERSDVVEAVRQALEHYEVFSDSQLAAEDLVDRITR